MHMHVLHHRITGRRAYLLLVISNTAERHDTCFYRQVNDKPLYVQPGVARIRRGGRYRTYVLGKAPCKDARCSRLLHARVQQDCFPIPSTCPNHILRSMKQAET